MLGLCSTCLRLPETDRTPLANSPDWLKAAPMQENLLASWRQSGQKQDHCPSLLNHNAKYKRLLPPYCDFANGVRAYWTRGLRAARSESRRAWRTRAGCAAGCRGVACTSTRGGDASDDRVACLDRTGAGGAVAADNDPPCPTRVAAANEAGGGLSIDSGLRDTAPVTSGSTGTGCATTRAGS